MSSEAPSVAQGAAVGAGGGAAFGPWGAGIGAGIGAAGSLLQGQAQSDALKRAAQIQDQNAELDLEASRENAAKVQTQGVLKTGAIENEEGAAGVTSNSGSALDVLRFSAANAELDRLNVLHGGVVRQINAQNQSSMDAVGAESALQGSYMNAVGGILKGGATAFSMGKGVAPGDYTPVTGTNGTGNMPGSSGYDSALGDYSFGQSPEGSIP